MCVAVVFVCTDETTRTMSVSSPGLPHAFEVCERPAELADHAHGSCKKSVKGRCIQRLKQNDAR